MQEREQEYHRARARIFGDGAGGPGGYPGGPGGAPPPPPRGGPMNGAAGGMMGGMPGAGPYAGMMGPMSPQMAAGMGYAQGGARGKGWARLMQMQGFLHQRQGEMVGKAAQQGMASKIVGSVLGDRQTRHLVV